MRHARPDYNERIVDLEGRIPEDEPVFLLRGQDRFAPRLLLMWASELRLSGGDPYMAQTAEAHAQAMIEWQKAHRVKTPDMYQESAERIAKRRRVIELKHELILAPGRDLLDRFLEELEGYLGSLARVAIVGGGQSEQGCKAEDFPDKDVVIDRTGSKINFLKFNL